MQLGSGIAFLGDVMLGRGVAATVSPAALRRALEELSSGRAWIVNLECCVTERRETSAHVHSGFAGSPDLLRALRDAGCVAANLANNHSLDFGRGGLDDTVSALQGLGITSLGVRTPEGAIQPLELDTGGRTLAVFGCCALSLPAAIWQAGIIEASSPDLHRAIADRIQRGHDVIVSVHWGHEKVTVPPPEVRRLAAQFAALGVRLVVGHGPHVAQGFETIGRCHVHYSLGDAVFDRGGQENRDWGVMLLVDEDTDLVITPHLYRLDADTHLPRLHAAPELQARFGERSAILLDPQRYHACFATQAGHGFVGQQVRSTLRLLRRAGWRGVLVKARGLRPRHFRLLAYSTRGWFSRLSG